MGNKQVPEESNSQLRAGDIIIDEFVGHTDGSFELRASPEVIAQLANYARRSGWFSIVLGANPSSGMQFSWPEPGYDKMIENDRGPFYLIDIKGPQRPQVYLLFNNGKVTISWWFSYWHRLEGIYSVALRERSIIFKVPTSLYEGDFMKMLGLS